MDPPKEFAELRELDRLPDLPQHGERASSSHNRGHAANTVRVLHEWYPGLVETNTCSRRHRQPTEALYRVCAAVGGAAGAFSGEFRRWDRSTQRASGPLRLSVRRAGL